MSKLTVAYKNNTVPEQVPVKPLYEILKEKWSKKDKERAERKYGNRKK